MKRILLILCMLTLLAGTALADGPHRLRSQGYAIDLYDEGDQIRIIVGGETWIYNREPGGGGQVTGPEKGLHFDKAVDALTQWETMQGRVEPMTEEEASPGFVPGTLLALAGAFAVLSPRMVWQLIAGGRAKRQEPPDELLARYRRMGAMALVAGLAVLFLL